MILPSSVRTRYAILSPNASILDLILRSHCSRQVPHGTSDRARVLPDPASVRPLRSANRGSWRDLVTSETMALVERQAVSSAVETCRFASLSRSVSFVLLIADEPRHRLVHCGLSAILDFL